MKGETSGIGRQKFWDELSDSEKIERTREQVKSYQGMQDMLNSRLALLENHTHSSNGEITISYKEERERRSCMGSVTTPQDPEKSYF